MSGDLKWCPLGCVGSCRAAKGCRRRTFSAWFRERRPPTEFLDRVESIIEAFKQAEGVDKTGR